MKTLTVLFLALTSICTAFGQESNEVSSIRVKEGKDTYVYRNNDVKTVYRTSTGVTSFNVEMRGKIELTDDDRDIKSMSPDGYLEVTKVVFGSKRTLVVSAQSDGLKREYYEGRTPLPYEPEGRKWMNEIMPELVRSTTIGAESRVNRFYRQGGTTAVLAQIGAMDSDYTKHHYANLLMAMNVPAKDYVTIVNKLAESVESSYYLSDFLKKNLSKLLTSKEATDAVFAATLKMDSDHYKTEVIKEALRTQAASPDAIKSILAAAGQMDSDHYKTEVLTSLLRQPSVTDATISEMINASRSIDSDHYKTVVLTKALAKQGLSATSYQRVLESVKDIDSDHYKTQVLTDLLRNKLPNEEIFKLVDLSTSISSDHYLTQVFSQVMKSQELNDESFKALIERASKVDSDHYASSILQSAMSQPSINDARMMAILAAAANIDSDHYMTEVLTRAAPKVKAGSSALKDAYRSAARRIESEVYYGRALKAIDF